MAEAASLHEGFYEQFGWLNFSMLLTPGEQWREGGQDPYHSGW